MIIFIFFFRLNKYFKDHPELKDKTEGISLLFDMMQMGNDAGDSWWEVSTTSISEFKDSPGDYMVNWKERGYGTILDILMVNNFLYRHEYINLFIIN